MKIPKPGSPEEEEWFYRMIFALVATLGILCVVGHFISE